MPSQEVSLEELEREAYAIAWNEFNNIETMTPDEIMYGPSRLRWYIQIMAEVGERDPQRIARAALGMVREYEQILRSRARIESGPAASAA